jgi:hypothetical protein
MTSKTKIPNFKGIGKDIVLNDGDVLLVHIPTHVSSQQREALRISLGKLLLHQGLDNEIAIVSNDIKFSVLKKGKGESKQEIKKASFRLIRLGEEEV